MKLGERLLQEKIITQEQLQKALDCQKKAPGTRIGEVLVILGFATYGVMPDSVELVRDDRAR